jgi:hypothetical protein
LIQIFFRKVSKFTQICVKKIVNLALKVESKMLTHLHKGANNVRLLSKDFQRFSMVSSSGSLAIPQNSCFVLIEHI